jgi:hypothetical protein
MHRMDFREIGRLVSEDRLSLEYLWKHLGVPPILYVIPLIFIL